MDELKQRILRDGCALSDEVLLVDSFLNHQVDVELMAQIGREFAQRFKDEQIDRVVPIESSGIAPAAMTAWVLGVPLVIMKKAASKILNEETLQTCVHSFTKNSDYMLTIKKKYVHTDDRVLLIDDFLANGEAAMGAACLIESAGAKVSGIGIVIDKAFQPGHKRLVDAGYRVVSLARIRSMARDRIEFVNA